MTLADAGAIGESGSETGSAAAPLSKIIYDSVFFPVSESNGIGTGAASDLKGSVLGMLADSPFLRLLQGSQGRGRQVSRI